MRTPACISHSPATLLFRRFLYIKTRRCVLEEASEIYFYGLREDATSERRIKIQPAQGAFAQKIGIFGTGWYYGTWQCVKRVAGWGNEVLRSAKIEVGQSSESKKLMASEKSQIEKVTKCLDDTLSGWCKLWGGISTLQIKFLKAVS
jgi:hypothetical protein